MRNIIHKSCRRWTGFLALLSLLLFLDVSAQTTTPNVKVDILGTGAESLLGSDLTDPENDGEDALGSAASATWNWRSITSSHEPDFEGGENSFNIFDNKVGGGNNKWCCDDPTVDNPVWVSVEFRQAVSLTHFTVTSGNDSPDRDPTNWAIQGSNDGTTFTDIYRFVDTTLPWDARNQVVKFTLATPAKAYSHIRYIAFETPGTLHQLNEIEYFGGAGAAEPAIKKGLVAYWDFEGNFQDQIGAFHGTAAGAETIPFVAGKTGFGKAIKMNGEDQEIEITGGEPDDLAFQDGSMSIAGWFKVDAFDTDWQALVAKGEGSSWRVHRRGGESGFAHAGGTGEGPAGVAVNDGNWHHFAAISDKDAVNFGTALYVDGVQYTVNANAPVLAANGKRMMIGENPDALGREWEGEIDDLAVWNRVLTEAEIGQLYANGSGKALSELLGAVVGDLDKDGIPDTAEVEFGLNPNDPSDAAKDFDGDGVSNLNEYKAGTNPVDVTKPAVVSVASTGSFNTVNITFSEEIDPATATAVANYTISPALAVTAAAYSKKVVTLTTANQAPNATAYTITIKGIKDTSKNEVAADTKVTFYSYLLTRTGVLRFAYWGSIPGASPVSNLTDDPRYPASPDLVAAVNSFNSRNAFPDDSHENYGAVMEGFISPTESANYRFFIYSDDASQLFLSTDQTEANLLQIAEETGCCNFFAEPDGNHTRTSEPIALVAGRKYYVRFLYKEGGGGDYGQIAWRKEGDATPAASLTPIPGKFLSSAVDLAVPAEGSFTARTPAANAKNVSPATSIRIAHIDGKTEWTAANVSLKLDGVAVTPTFTKDANLATIVYTPTALLASKSTHIISLGYVDPGGNPTTLESSFEVAEYKGPIKDAVKGYNALLLGVGKQTDDKGGFSGAAGDRGIDLTKAGAPVQVVDASFLTAVNAATTADELSVSMWIKKYDIADSSAFWFSSPTQGRVFQAHTPWSNNNVYFDTAGCCGGDTRINASIDTLSTYTGDVTWWNTWHHFAFTKKADAKQIWIDGLLFLEGSNSGLLSKDINQLMIAADSGGGNRMHAVIDDFAVYSKALTEANVTALKGGGKPTALPASAGLVAYWDFNSLLATEGAKFSKISIAAGNITMEWTGGGVLQRADSVTGPWTDVAGATSPRTVSATGTGGFYRIKQ